MRPIFLLVSCGLLFVSPLLGQEASLQTSSLRLELAGSGGIGSLNFEQAFVQRQRWTGMWRIGMSFAPIDRNNGVALIFPLLLQGLYGKAPHYLEVGLGQGLTITTKGQFFLLGTASAGYRFSPADRRWFASLSYTPLISYIFNFQVQQWGGISLGYYLE
ncbi:MAG: hypothetical protein AAF399_23580 [Bacteroidota bacterium]